jgi:hypothetical protein
MTLEEAKLAYIGNSGKNANIEQAPIAIGGISNIEVKCRNANINIEQ